MKPPESQIFPIPMGYVLEVSQLVNDGQTVHLRRLMYCANHGQSEIHLSLTPYSTRTVWSLSELCIGELQRTQSFTLPPGQLPQIDPISCSLIPTRLNSSGSQGSPSKGLKRRGLVGGQIAHSTDMRSLLLKHFRAHLRKTDHG